MRCRGIWQHEGITGEILAPPEYPTEHAQRGGHIPGAKNIPWAQAVNEDGTFKTPEELKALYEPKGVTPDKEIIAYCRIGERSSHTWFVLKYLLGYPDVRNYDGSWTEWGTSSGRQSRNPNQGCVGAEGAGAEDIATQAASAASFSSDRQGPSTPLPKVANLRLNAPSSWPIARIACLKALFSPRTTQESP